jgi:hypothetical protein
MALRTTADKVRVILETDMSTEMLDEYISIASASVDGLDATVLSSTTLAEIERWLTAHLISISRDRPPVKERIGDAEVTYTYDNVFGKGLYATHYGQWVAQLDTTGTLAAQGKKKVSIIAVTSFEN